MRSSSVRAASESSTGALEVQVGGAGLCPGRGATFGRAMRSRRPTYFAFKRLGCWIYRA
jgi:hypothetical protein